MAHLQGPQATSFLAFRSFGCIRGVSGMSLRWAYPAGPLHPGTPPSRGVLAIPAAAAIQNAKLYETARIYGEALESRLNSLKRAETALAQSEGSLKSSEERFEKVFRSSPIPFSITTLKEGRFLDVNAAFERRYGYTRAEVLGHTVHELRMWEDPADRDLMLAQLSKGGPIQNVMTRLRVKSGEIKITAYSADRIQFEGESCILAVSEDVPQVDPHKSN